MKRLVVLSVALCCAVAAQDRYSVRGGTTQDAPAAVAPRTPLPGEVGTSPGIPRQNPPSTYDTKGMKLTAHLLDAGRNAVRKEADIQVDVAGIQLTDPDVAREHAQKDQGHLEYRVDNGPVVATTSTKLSFRELPSGSHRIVVGLVANDGTPLGPHQVLEVDVP